MKTRGIVMSGLPGSGKSVLCKKLQAEYGWPIHSIGDMLRAEWKEKYPNEEVSFENYWRSTSDEDNMRVNIEMRERMLEHNLIVDSRYTAFYCKDLPFFRIFLTAGLEIRAERGLGKYKDNKKIDLGVSEIGPILRAREEDEIKMGSKLFDNDYREPSHYQLILDTGIITVDQEFETVRRAISKLG